jgi:FKBP-type peptidyl-prolyl cis-trans isomerase 2
MLVGEVPKGNLPENVKIGETLQGMTEQGPVVVKVVEILDDIVKVDANHPLAGKKLIFDLAVVEIN